MISKTSYALVGAFVLILSAALIWGVLWISSGGPPQDYDSYLVYMTDSVSGLNVDAPVKFKGVDVGKVQQISIDAENPDRVRLVLLVRRGTPITEDTVANLEYQGLTGIANVNLSGGWGDSLPLGRRESDELPVIPSRSSIFSHLDLTLSDLLYNLIETSASLNDLLNEENRANVSRSIENIANLTEKFADQSRQLDGIIEDLAATLENTRAASVGLPELILQFSRSAESISEMADQIGAVSENFATDINTTTLPEIGAMVHELRLAAENLRRMSEALVENPSVLIYGSPEPRPGPGESGETPRNKQ
ncbi:MAG: MlaD family protein [Xanthomonadales bacterium]|jgi:phospholipid/cholesterol/gamma-HCH transport system substrate-binding protein|nr:MlaD family protein [Xanthomonadales bacterium]MDH3939517.1 MlaD family protein [Xanthomonadales bacterium]MDH4000849.1 MlaD family protein [Xanthomonadales bacterium]